MVLNGLAKNSLKTRVTLSTLAIFLVSIWSLALYTSRMLRQDMQHLLGEQQFSTVTLIAAEIDHEMSARMRSLESVARGITPELMSDQAGLQAMLESRTTFQQMFNGGILVLAPDGATVAYVPLTLRQTGTNYMNHDAVAAALKQGKATIGQPRFDKRVHAPLFPMAMPIRDGQGKVIGALAGATYLGKSSFLETMTGNSYGKTGGFVLIVPQHRLVVVAPDRNISVRALPAPGTSSWIDRIVQGYEGTDVFVNPGGIEVLTSVKQIPSTGWIMAVEMPTEEAFAPIQSMQQRMLLAAIFLTLLAGTLTWWMLKRHLAPMLDAVKILADLTATNQPTHVLPIVRQDEIGDLIGGFNRLLEALAAREASLRHSEASKLATLNFNEQILLAAPIGILTYDITGKCLNANIQATDLLGASQEQLLAQNFRQIDSWKTSGLLEFAETTLASGRSARKEFHIRTSFGKEAWLDAVSSRFVADNRPHLLLMIADVSLRKQKEEQTRQLLAENQSILNNALVGIAYLKQRRIVSCNRRLEEIFHYDPGELIGQTTERLYDTRENFLALGEHAYRELGEGKKYSAELMLRHKDGSLFWGALNGCAIDQANPHDGSIWIYADISERRHAEQLLIEHQANLEAIVMRRTAQLSEALEAAKLSDRTKDEFLANITHELRTPLSAVIGMAGLARGLCTDSKQRDYLQKISTAGQHLHRIINELLDLSKIAAGHMQIEAITFSLRALIRHCASVMEHRAAEKYLEFILNIADEVPDVLVGDSFRIEQILLNLVGNAIKFTPAGRVEIRISQGTIEERRVRLKIEVEDTGIGIRLEDMKQLFKPFSQADATVSRKFGGSGLGLAICKQLTELMGGEISVTKREGNGTIFAVVIWLSLGKASDLPVAADMQQEPTQVIYQDARVLVVDDQPFNRDVVEGLLSVVGISPQLAENGQESLDILACSASGFDLVLMDIQMPIMDGLAATRAIRKMAGFAQLPIIAMTAHAMAHEIEIGAAAGMNDHIGKPFDEAGFYRMLAKWIPADKQRLRSTDSAPLRQERSLPPIPGVDTDAGLRLMQGDEARYRHWLRDFNAEAPDAIAQIRLALTEQDTERASMTAHALKGRTGLLGMTELHAMAAAIEAAIDGAAPTRELLTDLERGISAMCAEIERVLGKAETPPPSSEISQPPPCVTRLVASLQRGDGDSNKYIESCLAELRDTEWEPRLREALTLAQNFDYIAAGRLLSGSHRASKLGI